MDTANSLREFLAIRAHLQAQAAKTAAKIQHVDAVIIDLISQFKVGDRVADCYGDPWEITKRELVEQTTRMFVVYSGRRIRPDHTLLPKEHLMLLSPFSPLEYWP